MVTVFAALCLEIDEHSHKVCLCVVMTLSLDMCVCCVCVCVCVYFVTTCALVLRLLQNTIFLYCSTGMEEQVYNMHTCMHIIIKAVCIIHVHAHC